MEHLDQNLVDMYLEDGLLEEEEREVRTHQQEILQVVLGEEVLEVEVGDFLTHLEMELQEPQILVVEEVELENQVLVDLGPQVL
jgi:hypothetical protein